MSPDNFLHLHDILLGFGLKGTRETGSLECLGIYVWTCAHDQAVRRSRDIFERSLDTVSRKMSHVTEVMCRWAHSVLVPADNNYAGVNWQLGSYARTERNGGQTGLRPPLVQNKNIKYCPRSPILNTPDKQTAQQ